MRKTDITSTKHLRMISELGWSDQKACEELHCSQGDFEDSKTGVGNLPLLSAYLLCKKYNEIMKPSENVSLDQLVKDE